LKKDIRYVDKKEFPTGLRHPRDHVDALKLEYEMQRRELNRNERRALERLTKPRRGQA
jgi:hypothetical protein